MNLIIQSFVFKLIFSFGNGRSLCLFGWTTKVYQQGVYRKNKTINMAIFTLNSLKIYSLFEGETIKDIYIDK